MTILGSSISLKLHLSLVKHWLTMVQNWLTMVRNYLWPYKNLTAGVVLKNVNTGALTTRGCLKMTIILMIMRSN